MRMTGRMLQSVDSGWKSDNCPSLSLGAELNWQYYGFVSKATTSCGCSNPYCDLSLYKPCSASSASVSVHLRKPSATWISILVYKHPTKKNSTYGLTYCFVSLQNVTPFFRLVSTKLQDILQVLFTSCKWTVTQLGKITATVQMTSNVYRLPDSEQKPGEHLTQLKWRR